jgi:hypothetical protein
VWKSRERRGRPRAAYSAAFFDPLNRENIWLNSASEAEAPSLVSERPTKVAPSATMKRGTLTSPKSCERSFNSTCSLAVMLPLTLPKITTEDVEVMSALTRAEGPMTRGASARISPSKRPFSSSLVLKESDPFSSTSSEINAVLPWFISIVDPEGVGEEEA